MSEKEEIVEIVYKSPVSKNEHVRYRATTGTKEAESLIAQVDKLNSIYSENPYSCRYVQVT